MGASRHTALSVRRLSRIVPVRPAGVYLGSPLGSGKGGMSHAWFCLESWFVLESWWYVDSFDELGLIFTR